MKKILAKIMSPNIPAAPIAVVQNPQSASVGMIDNLDLILKTFWEQMKKENLPSPGLAVDRVQNLSNVFSVTACCSDPNPSVPIARVFGNYSFGSEKDMTEAAIQTAALLQRQLSVVH